MSGIQTFFRGAEGGPPSRDATIPRFHIESVKDELASAEQGRPIFKDEERIQYINPGSQNQPVERVNDSHRQRWPEQYAAFKRGAEMAVEGTPLEQWPVMTRSMVNELKALGLYTVEQCSVMPDTAVQRIGRGGYQLRERAKAYLDEADSLALSERLNRENESLNSRVTAQDRQISELKDLVEKLHTSQMATLNTAPALQSHIPGAHDPMEALRQAAPQAAPEPSALDNLAPRRPRGRPTNAELAARAGPTEQAA